MQSILKIKWKTYDYNAINNLLKIIATIVLQLPIVLKVKQTIKRFKLIYHFLTKTIQNIAFIKRNLKVYVTEKTIHLIKYSSCQEMGVPRHSLI